MTYAEQFQQLKEVFDPGRDEIVIPGSTTRIVNIDFQSRIDPSLVYEGQQADNQIAENMQFRYPVIIPGTKAKADSAIIFLHGLNERSWHKHLAGARLLAEKSGKAVVMFPLSYHINRGLPQWTDARKMAGFLELRKRKYPGVREATLVNLALSERLTEYPQRFFISGLQSTLDLIALMKQIRRGDHPLFESGTKADIFAYSISCMLLQSLMISNPDNILSNSRIVFFAGGSLFSHMQGVSRYIMDSVAFAAVRKFYTDIVKKKNSITHEIQLILSEQSFGKAFKSLLAPGFLAKPREQAMSNFSKNLMIIAMRDDKVMPLSGIMSATGERFYRSGQFRTVHFPYAYSHENPFPVLYKKIDEQVEKAFRSVYEPALKFFTV
jgi:hypothetical protein